jgi:predicted nucleotidyltransferase
LHEPEPTIKHLLYAYRVLLTGIHLMDTGEVVANLPELNRRFELSYVDGLVERKRLGSEAMRLDDADVAEHERNLDQLEALLLEAHANSSLPEEPRDLDALEDFVVRTRLAADAGR